MLHEHEEEYHGNASHHEGEHGGESTHNLAEHVGHHTHENEQEDGGGLLGLGHMDDEDDEIGIIAPAGTINDISYCENPDIDIALLYPLSDTFATDHGLGKSMFDLTNKVLPYIDLSFLAVLSLEKLKNPKFKDIFLEREFAPLSAFALFFQKYIKRKQYVEYLVAPRYEEIRIQKPILSEFNSVDIRNVRDEKETSKSNSKKKEEEVIESPKYVDIYKLPLPFGKKIQTYMAREKVFLLRVAVFSIIGIFFGIGLLGISLWYTKYNIEAGVIALKNVQFTLDTNIAKNAIQKTSSHFEQARIFSKAAYLVRPFGYDSEMNLVIQASEGFAAIGEILSMLDSLRSELVREEYPSYSGEYFSFNLFTNSGSKYTDFALRHISELKRIQDLIAYAEYRFSSIDTAHLDSNTRQGVEELVTLLQGAHMTSDFLQENSEAILTIAGSARPMKYLLLNQNKDEIRANGGFPGSAIEFEVYKGKLIKHVKRDIYYYDWNLYPYAETPPPGISEITKSYGIRDANYEPNFADSFVTINRFFEKSGGATLDGAFAIHQGLVEKILAITGPVSISGVSEPFTSKNFSRNMSILVETEFGRKNSPKDILFEFMDSLIYTVHSQNLYSELFTLLRGEVSDGQVVGFIRDTSAEKFLQKLQAPPIYEASPNFIEPIFTSISGNKSDRYMKRDFILKSTSTGSCMQQNTLEIISAHTFSFAEERIIRDTFTALSIDPKKIAGELAIQGKGENKQYVRLLVPKNAVYVGSTFKNVETITTHEKYDMFTFKIDTGAGEISRVNITYSLPEGTCREKTDFTVQPGLTQYTFKKQ